LSSKDRCMIGWDEITSMGLSPDAAVMTWHRPETAVAAAQAGNKVVMALTGHAYFDTPESKLPGEPPAATWLPPITLKKAYEWEPAPAAIEGQARKNILGAHGCMWTDRFMHNPILQDMSALNEGRSYDYVEYLSLPRMAALAEVTWTPQAKRGWDSFEQRMKLQYNRYSHSGYNFRVPLPKVDKPVKADQGYKITAECLVDNARICYTTDGTYPSSYSRVYEKPILIEDPQQFQAITVVDKRHVSLAFSFPKDKPKK
jgi:hexosaminidase